VGALPEIEVVDVDGVGILRVGGDVDVVPGTRDQVLVVADLLPVLTKVIGAIESTFLALFDERPDAAGLGRRCGPADLAENTARQIGPAGDVLPGLAAITGAPQTAVRTTAADLPEGAVRLPDGRVEDARIGRVEAEIDRARPVADEEDVPPGRAA